MNSSERPALGDVREYWLNAAEPRLAALCGSYDELSPAEVQARRQALAAESAAIRSFLWKFDTSFNELQPVSRVPSEVMAHIFSIVEASNPVGGDELQSEGSSLRPKTSKKHDYVDWLSVTRVCRRWRKDALACSLLWSRMPLSMGTKGIDTFLSRSRNASLIVDCVHISLVSNLIEVMQSAHLTRTRRLCIPVASLNPTDGRLLSMLQNPAPQLEIFALHSDRDASRPCRRGATAIELPQNLFNNDSPRLYAFYVCRVNCWPAYPALFARLRVFSVINDAAQGYTFPLLSEMRDALRSMPQLGSLRLKNSMARGHDLSDDNDLIMLPRLRKLELSGPVTACSGVIRPLRVAAGCRIVIVASDWIASLRDQAAALIDDLHTTGFNVGFVPKSLAIAVSDLQLHVCAFRESVQDPRTLRLRDRSSPHRDESDQRPEAAFSFRLDAVREHEPSILSVMVEHTQRLLAHTLPTHSITSASVSTPTHVSTPGPNSSARTVFEPLWTAALAPCSRLTHLHAAGSGAHVFLRKLAEPHPASALFPALNLFVFDEPQISRTWMFEGLSLYDILLVALQRRAIASVQIPVSPQLNEADMDALRALSDLQTYSSTFAANWAGVPGLFPNWAAAAAPPVNNWAPGPGGGVLFNQAAAPVNGNIGEQLNQAAMQLNGALQQLGEAIQAMPMALPDGAAVEAQAEAGPAAANGDGAAID